MSEPTKKPMRELFVITMDGDYLNGQHEIARKALEGSDE